LDKSLEVEGESILPCVRKVLELIQVFFSRLDLGAVVLWLVLIITRFLLVVVQFLILVVQFVLLLLHCLHDTTQVATKMTKEAKDKAHGEQSSQRTIQDPTKDHMDLTRGAGYKPAHQLLFLLVFL